MTVLRMRGVRLAKTVVHDFLAAEFPPHLARLRLEWQLAPEQLPDPKRYHRNPLLTIDQWPVLALDAQRAPTLRRTGYTDDLPGVEYAARYSLRVFCWVNAEGYDACIDQRDDITTAVRRLFVESPTIGVPDEAAVVQENTLQESYSDVTKAKGDRYVAGSFVAFDLLVVEGVALGVAGTVVSASVAGSALPPHPALD